MVFRMKQFLQKLLFIVFVFPVIVNAMPDAWDDFQRPDAIMQTGDLSPSGHVYKITGVAQQYILDERYNSDALGAASIAYLQLESKPIKISAKFIFTDEGKPLQHFSENAVIGTAEAGFGLGSIQLGIWRDRWQLFVVQNPIIDPYPIIMSLKFDEPLQPEIEYSMSLEWDELTSSITVFAPDGGVMMITHPEINQYWGSRFAIQMRRSRDSFGKVRFNSSAAYLQ